LEYREALEDFGRTLSERLSSRSPLRVLDAGCGSHLKVELPPHAYVVGVDVSPEALDENPLLSERIVGDLERIELTQASFDVIVCWDVLEHVRRPRAVLDRLARALADGGILVLGAPNVLSLKGLATKFTPYAFHRWIYARAATSRSEPYPTFLRLAMAPRAVRRWAERNGFAVDYVSFYEAPIQPWLRRTLHVPRWCWRALSVVVATISLGRIATDDTDYLLILSRRGAGR